MHEQEVKVEFVLFEKKLGGEQERDKQWPAGVVRSEEGHFR